MFGMDQAMLFLHLLAALWLTGAAFGGTIVRAQARRATDLREKVAGLRTMRRLAMVMGLPGAVLAGLLGVELARRLEIPLASGWVATSIGLWVVMILVNVLYLLPLLKRALAAGEASLAAGQASAEFQALAGAKLPQRIADLNAVAIVIFTFLMVFKPF